jgi:hypothetical protein
VPVCGPPTKGEAIHEQLVTSVGIKGHSEIKHDERESRYSENLEIFTSAMDRSSGCPATPAVKSSPTVGLVSREGPLGMVMVYAKSEAKVWQR